MPSYPKLIVFGFLTLLPGCREGASISGTEGSEVAAGVEVLVGAGDIASCVSAEDRATAQLLDGIEGTVFTAGDHLDLAGTDGDYARCFEAGWGRHRDRMFPAIGNQDYDVGADAYFAYFGARAGPPGLGYYSYDLGAWHVVVLNSNPTQVPTHRGSAQEAWLRDDLAAAGDTRCVLAIWHHPRFYQGPWNVNASVRAFWDALYDAGADLVVNGHHHLYERYAPQTPDGAHDPERGIRQIIVGTGGQGHDVLVEPAPNVEVRDNTTFGVLALTLASDRYHWAFRPVAGGTFADSGSASCH